MKSSFVQRCGTIIVVATSRKIQPSAAGTVRSCITSWRALPSVSGDGQSICVVMVGPTARLSSACDSSGLESTWCSVS